MRLLLTSAGLSNDLLAIALERLFGQPLSEASILFITTAANTGTDDKRWLIDNLNDFVRYGCRRIDLLDVAGLHDDLIKIHLEAADIICVGGGDERYLTRIIRDQKLKDIFLPYLQEKVYMGISAGSIVTGKILSSEVTKMLYPEEDFASEIGETFGFAHITFAPHLNSVFFEHARISNFESIIDTLPRPLYALDDETGLSITGDGITVVGEGVYWTLT